LIKNFVRTYQKLNAPKLQMLQLIYGFFLQCLKRHLRHRIYVESFVNRVSARNVTGRSDRCVFLFWFRSFRTYCTSDRRRKRPFTVNYFVNIQRVLGDKSRPTWLRRKKFYEWQTVKCEKTDFMDEITKYKNRRQTSGDHKPRKKMIANSKLRWEIGVALEICGQNVFFDVDCRRRQRLLMSPGRS